ncbi:MAG: alcohol dehydrogenase [Shinella sp.]|nr:MAG: alcohol dehydrogenase [Shinella sp.]
MLALQKARPEAGLEFREVEPPSAPSSNEVLIKVEAAGICGTDLHIAAWTPGYESMQKAMPVTLGHEFSGVIEQVGADVSHDLIGKRVTVRPSTTCGHCPACLAGREDDCGNRKGIGIGRSGAFAALVCGPASNCHVLPDSLDMEIAALTEPMTVCLEAVNTAEVREGQSILVLGPGFIGQGIAILARSRGARVVVAGRDDRPRLELLRDLGFEFLIDGIDTPIEQALAEYPPFDAIIEAAGVPALVNATLPFLKKRGIFTVVGIHPRPAEVNLTQLVRMHQQIRGSYRASPADWDATIAFLNDNQDVMRKLISHRFPLYAALQGFEVSHQRLASKVVLQIGAPS